MPQRKSLIRAARRRLWRWDEWDEESWTAPLPGRRSGRLASTIVFVGSLALGAALSAGAAETLTTLVEDASTAVPVEAAVTDGAQPAEAASGEQVQEAVPAAHPLAEPEPVDELAPPPEATVPAVAESTPEEVQVAAPEPEPPIAAPRMSVVRERAKPKARPLQRAAWHPRAARLVRTGIPARRPGSELEAEASLPGVDATIWLNRSLPDPTPPSKRLNPDFARQLRSAASASQVDWALLLGLLRAEGRTGAAPAAPTELTSLAERMAALREQEERAVALALAGDSERADRAIALAHYHRAVGPSALVRGLEWARPRLEARLLRDDRVATYEGGRFDIESGRVDVRVLALIAYLADTYGEVTVSCLKTGHRLYARPGVISAHIYGLAVDISALGGTTIEGNQGPGGLTEQAVRDILLLPSELMPRQVISLLGLGGPSFPMGDHGDHIHVGY
jgi:hypothetical protein